MPIQHVLIVDDSKTEQMFISSIIKNQGMTVSFADNGDAAMVELERQKPDLILMDVIMPGKNGFQLTRQISKDERFADIPSSFVPAKARKQTRYGAYARAPAPMSPSPSTPANCWKKSTLSAKRRSRT